jgi:hypothetical protein
MVVHHVIRCCCIFLPSSSSVTAAVSGPSQSQIEHILSTCPAEIRATNESYLLLYVFVVYKNRLPRAEEQFLNKKLGEWVVRIRANECGGKLTATEKAALAKMPMWQPYQCAQQPVAYKKSAVTVQQPAPQRSERAQPEVTERSALLKSEGARGREPEPAPVTHKVSVSQVGFGSFGGRPPMFVQNGAKVELNGWSPTPKIVMQ